MKRKQWTLVTLLAAAALWFTASPVGAQEGGLFGLFGIVQLPPPVLEKLKLTDDQKSKLTEIRSSMVQQRQALFQEAQNNGGGFQDALQKFRPVMEKSNADALALLMPEQKKTFEALRAERENYVSLGPRSSMALLLVAGITDDEKSKLKALGNGIRANIAAAIAQGGGIQGVQKLFADIEAGVRKLLTADQLKQFDAVLETIPQQRLPRATQ